MKNQLTPAELATLNYHYDDSEDSSSDTQHILGTISICGIDYHLRVTTVVDSMSDDFIAHAYTKHETNTGVFTTMFVKTAGNVLRHSDSEEADIETATYEAPSGSLASFTGEVFISGGDHPHAQKLREALHRMMTHNKTDERVK